MIATAQQCDYCGFWPLPRTEWLPDRAGRRMRLLCNFHYTDKAGMVHTAREGLVTDGGSIPRFFWRLIGSPYTSPARFAYLIHDQMCADSREIGGDAGVQLRRVADTLFAEMLERLGIARWRVTAMFRAVRFSALSI